MDSPDWSHLLQTQAASEVQIQMRLDTQTYNPEGLWGLSEDQLDTQHYDADHWPTQPYGHASAVASFRAEMETATTSLLKRVKKKAMPMAKAGPRTVKTTRARAVKKRPAAAT